MIFSIIILIACMIALLLGVFVAVPVLGITEGQVVLTVMYSLIALVGIDMFCAIVLRFCLPKKLLNPFLKIYKVSNFERKLFEKLGVRVWKDKIPEAGKYFANFNKSEIDANAMKDNKYVYLFMQETISGEIIHFFSAILSFLIIFINLNTFLYIALPMMIANFIINIMPVIVQRYNRPKLMVLYKRNERLSAKQS